MTDNLTNNPAAYLSELQRIEREQELAKLRTLSLEFAGVLNFFPQLREELEAFHHADGIAFDGLADRVRPILKQAADLQFEIEYLPAELRNASEMQAFLQQVKKIISLQSVNRLEVQFQGVCQDIRQRFEKEKLEAQRRAKEEAERQAKEKAEAEGRAREEEERQAKEKAEAECRAREEEERQAKEKAEAERRAREEEERQAKEKRKFLIEGKISKCKKVIFIISISLMLMVSFFMVGVLVYQVILTIIISFFLVNRTYSKEISLGGGWFAVSIGLLLTWILSGINGWIINLLGMRGSDQDGVLGLMFGLENGLLIAFLLARDDICSWLLSIDADDAKY